MGKNVVNWDLIATHFRDLMRVAISVREGTISSALLLRRLPSGSRKNAHYAAFREVGTRDPHRPAPDVPLRRGHAPAGDGRDEQG